MEDHASKRKTGKDEPAREEEGRDLNSAGNSQSQLALANLILRPNKSAKVGRPPNAFMLFARENRRDVAKKFPRQSNKMVSSLLGKLWSKMDDTAKRQYYEQSKMLTKLHKQQHPGYVYNPRIARMRKMERKNSRKPKNEIVPKEVKQERKSKRFMIAKEIGGAETVRHCLDQKPSSPEYVPNNPLFFAKVEPEETHREETTLLSSEDQGQPRNALQRYSPPSVPSKCFSRSTPEEFGIQTFRDSYYQRQIRHHPCDCEDCEDERRAVSYGPPMFPRWNPYAMDCMGECDATVPSVDRCRRSNKSSEQSVYKNHLYAPYQHYPANAPFGNTSLSHCDSFCDYKSDFCGLPPHYMKWKMSCEDQARNYYGNMANFRNRQSEWPADSRRSSSRPAVPPTANKNNLIPRPEMKQGVQSFTYIDELQYQDEDSRNFRPKQSESKFYRSWRPEQMETCNCIPNVSVSQCASDARQPSCQKSESISHDCHKYENVSNFFNRNPDCLADIRRSSPSRSATPPTASKSNLIPRPEMKQGVQSFTYIDKPEFQDLDSSNPCSKQTEAYGSWRPDQMETGNRITDISVPQCVSYVNQPSCQETDSTVFSHCYSTDVDNTLMTSDNASNCVTDTKKPSCQELEATNLLQTDIAYKCESNFVELSTTKKESSHFQAKDSFPASYPNETQPHSFKSTDPSADVAYYVSYETGSQEFVYQNVNHSEDELMNVQDVVEMIPQSSNIEVTEVQLEEKTDVETEKFV